MDKGILFWISPTVGVSIFDILLVTFCPLCGALGGYVSRHLKFSEFMRVNRNKITGDFIDDVKKFRKIVLNQFISESGPNPTVVGGVLGIVIALYFVGAITDHLTSLARVLALCILLGYQAPNLWRAQEQVIASIVDQKLKTTLQQQNIINENSLTSNVNKEIENE